MRNLSILIAAVMALTLISAAFAAGDGSASVLDTSAVSVNLTVFEWAELTAGSENIEIAIRKPGAWFGALDALTLSNNTPVELTIAKAMSPGDIIAGVTFHVIADPNESLTSYDWVTGVDDGDEGFTPTPTSDNPYPQWQFTWASSTSGRKLLTNLTAYYSGWAGSLATNFGADDGNYSCVVGNNQEIPILYAARGGSWYFDGEGYPYGTDYMPTPTGATPFGLTVTFQVTATN